MKSKLASSQGDDLASHAREVKGAKVLAVCIEDADSRALRETLDKFKDKFKSGVVVLGAIEDGRGQADRRRYRRSYDQGESGRAD